MGVVVETTGGIVKELKNIKKKKPVVKKKKANKAAQDLKNRLK